MAGYTLIRGSTSRHPSSRRKSPSQGQYPPQGQHFPQGQYAQSPADGPKDFAITAMVLGNCSLVIPYSGIVLGILAIVFASSAEQERGWPGHGHRRPGNRHRRPGVLAHRHHSRGVMNSTRTRAAWRFEACLVF